MQKQMMDKLIRVGIVDDHPGVRAAIRSLFVNANDIEIVGEGVNGAEALQLADQEKPDILLLDVEMPILRGDEVLQRVREEQPEVQVLALSSYNDAGYILGMLENGAAGYLLKEEAPSMLVKAVRSIVKDEVKWISPQVADHVSDINLGNKTFTGHELEVLRYIMLGREDEEITTLMKLTERLFMQHINKLMEKFEVSSRQDLKIAAHDVICTVTS
jgi:DNA-binding NarL/FixJ family response regulator